MLSVQLARAFGQTPDVPVPQLDTNVLSIGDTLGQVESNLKAAFNAMQVASVAAPNQAIATELIQAYQTNRAAFASAVQVWIEGYNQTPVNQRNPNDPNAVPVLPPDISVLKTSGGWGAASKGVLPSQIVVTYGPVGREKRSGLAASFYDPYFAYAQHPAGLGIEPVTGVLILIGLALLAGTLIAVTALLTKESDAAKIARADADRQKAASQAATAALTTRKDLILSCVNKSTDPNVIKACTVTADQGAVATLNALPQIKPSLPSGGGSVLATIGVIAILGVLGGGAYLVYRHGQRSGGGTRLPRATARSGYASHYDDDDDEW